MKKTLNIFYDEQEKVKPNILKYSILLTADWRYFKTRLI